MASQTISTTHLFALILACATLSIAHVLADESADTPRYRVPDPFGGVPADKQGEYYLVRSTQSAYSSHKQNEKLEVEEYFSLGDALTYSIHRVQSGKGDKGRAWALIGDGKYGRWYVLRNPDATDPDELECELDQVHSHRQVFPWQYVYDLGADAGGQSTIVDPFPGLLPEPTTKKRKRKKKGNTNGGGGGTKNEPRKSFVYGVGAIWLNAIKGDVRSTLVGARSPYDLSNSWLLESDRMRVELLFNKLADEAEEKGDVAEVQRALNAKPLATVKIDRKHLVESAQARAGQASGTASVDAHSEYIVVDEFKSGLNRQNSAEVLERLAVQLDLCRRANKKHRIFPSLLRAVSSSQQRIYELVYTARYMPAFQGDGSEHNGAYNERHHRYLHSLETVREFFSLGARTELIVYEPLAESEPGRGIDAFISRFADKPPGRRSTRHSTAYFHMFIAGDSETCEVGVREPLSKHHLLQRPFHFHESGQEHLAHIRGLGALLMNVADWPYKSFSIIGRKIKVAQNPLDLDDEREVETDEWLVEDKHSGWRVSLFIERRNRALEPVSWDLTERARADLKRLVRVDVRDMRAVDLAEDVIKTANENKNDDYDLLFQYTIAQVNFELPRDEVELFTSVPDICQEVIDAQPANEQADKEQEQKQDEEEEAEEEEKEEERSDREQEEDMSYEKEYHDNDDSDDDERDSTEGQDEGEQFEFEPGELHEDFPLPNFLDFLEDESTYKFTTKLELFEGDADPNEIEEGAEEEGEVVDRERAPEGAKRKHIWLSEVVDLKGERASVSVYNTDEALRRGEPDERYLVFYESEVLFRLTGDRCEHVKELDNKWLRLLSSRWLYYTQPNYSGRVHDHEGAEEMRVAGSSQLSLFGVGALWRRASDGEMAEYLGKRRAIIERDGKQYRQLVWLVQEFDMAVRFNFLMDEQSHDRKEFGHLVHNTPEQILKLDSISVSNELADGLVADHFKQVRVSVDSFEIGPDKSGALALPASCRDAWIEARRMSEIEPTPVSPPSMYDLLGGPHINGYYLHYVITHTAQVHQADLEPEGKSAAMQVVEQFNRARNRAKITVSFKGVPVDIFIEGESKRIYAYSTALGQCSAIDSLGPVFKALMGDLLLENREFKREQMYGLAGLINEFASKTAKVKTDSYLDRGGREEESRTYTLQLDAPKLGGSSGQTPLEVSMVYRKERPYLADNFDHVTKARIRAGDKLVLRSINLRPFQRRTKSEKTGIKKTEKSTLIYVIRQETFSGDDWTLPQACQDVQVQPDSSSSSSDKKTDADRAGEATQTSAAFPKVGSLLARLNSFHMRSEVTLQGQVNKVYLLDEWLHNGHLRMRARGLGKARENNFDFVIYLDTREQFDLSAPLACRANHFPPDVLGTTPAVTLLDVLLDETAQLDRLASLYYGPLALWRLADRYLESAKLIKSIEISMAHLDSADSFSEHISRELNKEIWQISAPASGAHNWTYSLEFHKYRRKDESGYLEWHVLDSIQVKDLEGTRTLVDVVNYNYRPDSNELLELFRLPEGWGCQRDAKHFDSLHDFTLDWRSNWYLTYEASLELIDPAQPTEFEDPELGSLSVVLGRREALPTLSGSYLRTYPSETQAEGGAQAVLAHHDRSSFANADLSVHVSHTRHTNGSSQLRRLVTDRRRPIEFEVDEQSGGCSVSRAFTGSWQLEFPADETTHKIYLLGVNADQLGFLFRQLFLETVGEEALLFAPLNKYSDDFGRTVHSSYEREFDVLRLAADLEGPARVVRRFDHERGQSGGPAVALNMRTLVDRASGLSRVVAPYDSLSVRVFLLSSDKKRVRAILDAKIRQHPMPRLSEFLASASVAECFNSGADPAWDRQVAHYTLEYPMREYAMRLIARYYVSVIADNLYTNLLRSARLMPLQLDGGARVDFSGRDDLLRVHFSVMDSPTSYLYFNEHVQCAMTDRVAAASELRLVSSLHECSRWCDQINCLAMSYCDDRTCRVATSRALFGSGERDSATKSERLDLADCQMQTACTYYYSKKRYRTRTLKSFRDFMERAVNSPGQGDSLKQFGLTFGIYNQIAPVRFYESSEMFRWQHEDKEDSLELAATDWTSGARPKYAKLVDGKMLDLAKLDRDTFHGLDSRTSLGSSTADCLSWCDRDNCLLVSHCRKSLMCRTIGALDLSAHAEKLAELRREIFVEADPDCAIFMRDHLDEFDQFDKTLVPGESSLKLEECTTLECAAACVAAGEACLSFDLCTPSDQTRQPDQENGGDDDDKTAGAYYYHEGAGARWGAGGPEQGTCFLQASHVTLDSFDRAVLLPAWDAEGAGENRNKIGNKSVVCEHHSRSLLLSFRRLANKKRRARTSASIKGISAERCAADCLRDDQCHAFEHCLNERRWPMQSCNLIRADDFVLAAQEPDEGGASETQQVKLEVSLESLGQLVTNSSYCSIYVANSLAVRERLDRTFAYSGELASSQSGSTAHGALLLIVLMLVAMLLGVAIQFAHIQLMGRPLLVR